jgi:hypothetical protein
MPTSDFDALPDDSRLWVFAASDAVRGHDGGRLLDAVDAWLADWKAHGVPLVCGRDWRDEHFLAVAVDEAATGASGCSVDALFRVLQQLQGQLGTSLVGGGRVFHRASSGEVRCSDRAAFARLAAEGEIGPDTMVFDTTVTTAGEFRRNFERPLRESWHRELAGAR